MAPPLRNATRRLAEKVYRRTPKRLRPYLKQAYRATSQRGLQATADGRDTPTTRAVASTDDIEHPIVSVVIPAKNEQEHLAFAINSVLSQDVTAVECIVVDDGSVDYTLDIAAEIAAVDRRVRVVRHAESRGLAAARNTGLALARAGHVTFLDGDDYLFPGSLSVRTRALARADQDVVGIYCDWMPVREVDPPTTPDRPPVLKPAVSLASSDGTAPFIATAPMLRTDAIKALGGFDETFRSAEDFELWMRVLRAGYTFLPVAHIGVAYRQRRSGMVLGDPATHARHMARVFDRADLAGGESRIDPVVRAQALTGSAILAAASDDPEQLQQIVALAQVIPIEAFDSAGLVEATSRAVSRVRKAVPGSPIADRVDDVLDQLRAAAHGSSTPSHDSIGLGPDGPLDHAIAARAIPLNQPTITPVYVKREAFGGVLLCPLARYHADELVPLAGELRARGHRVSFLLTPREGPEVAKEMRKYEEALFAWPTNFSELGDFTALVTLNDWGPVQQLVQFAGHLNIPTFSKVEGVQDFTDVDTGRLRKPYRWTDHVLCQGPNDLRSLVGRPTHMVGNSRLERIALGPERTFSPKGNTVVINSNFTYNVLTEARIGWLESAIDAVESAGAKPLISQHHADRDLNRKLPIAKTPLRCLFYEIDLLVSRFSTVPFEAMAHGVPFIYHNPHGELVPTFNCETDAYLTTRSTSELTEAIREALGWRGEYRQRASHYFSQQVDIDPTRSCEARSAEVIDRVLSRRR